MFLSDFTIFSKIAANSRSEAKFKDENDPEVDRLYNSSPIITESSTTYEVDDHYKIDLEETSSKPKDSGKIFAAANAFTLAKSQKSYVASVIDSESNGTDDLLLSDNTTTESKVYVSALTKMFVDYETKMKEDGNGKGKIALTIYLPNYSPLKISAKDTSDFKDVINIVLTVHKEKGIQPPLDYANPRNYELRIHEGDIMLSDGEPDRDFPALDLSKKLKNFNLDDYCLCEIEDYGRNDESFSKAGGATTYGESGRTAPASSISNDLFSPSQFGPLSLFRSGDSSKKFANSNKSTDRRSSDGSGADFILEDERFATVSFPSGNQVELPFEPETTFADLLKEVARTNRLRLYTDEYMFTISQKDQVELMYMTPIMDLSQRVSEVGTKAFEIKKKMYADTPRLASKVPVVTSTTKRSGERHSTHHDNICFNEATANAYQEWNVVKKNKFGRKQERVFGVDGKKVYNSKRGQYRGGVATGVQRAERDISTIVKNEVLPNDPKTFRITWMDDKDIYNIEYSCETERECAEIVAKIKFILSRLRNKR